MRGFEEDSGETDGPEEAAEREKNHQEGSDPESPAVMVLASARGH